jgi:YHS domain-containing protein
MIKRVSRYGLLSAVLLLQFAASAASPVEPVNTKGGAAVHGYDVVAYFTESRPVRGSAEFEHEWMGAKWRFASKQNRDTFAAGPEKYAPQFGGYCAWAVGHNYTADVDPEAWRIIDGKLYLNYNRSVQKQWEQDRDHWITDAHQNWPKLHK